MNLRGGYPLHALAEVIGATVVGHPEGLVVEHLAIDSRKPMAHGNTLFVALRGDRHDGHDYVPDLARKGHRCFLVEEVPNGGPSQWPRAVFLVAHDTLDALQRLAAWHRDQHRSRVVGITGSNGKTVVKEWLFQLLRGAEHVVRSPGSWNSQVGVPLSVWEMRQEHTVGLFEAGISQPGEMGRLRSIIKPTVGIFTTLGPAHGENFRSDAEKALEKLKLFEGAEALIYCADHAVVDEAIHESGLSQRVELLGWSRERMAWMHVVHERHTPSGTDITVFRGETNFTFHVPFRDTASVENALHCVALLLYWGRSPGWIAAHTPMLAPVAMRLELLDGRYGTTLINDAYSNDAASLAIALEQLGMVAGGRPRSVVLSDIVQSGESSIDLYGRVAHWLERHGVQQLLAVGPELAAHAHLFSCKVRSFPSPEALLDKVQLQDLSGHAVLIKGARAYALEKVVERWQRQVHGTVMEVDLEAIRHNLNVHRAMLAPGVRVMAMVKAFGYGNGALELARLFAHEQVHYLGVAYADEGIELRQQGIHLPILVMNPEPVPFETLHRFGLEAEVYDARSLREAMDHARMHPGAPPVHIKLDTGMNRLGFKEEDVPQLLELLAGAKELRVASLLTHLAASEDPAHDAFTEAQIAQFREVADAVDLTLGYRPLRHVANSAAVVRFPHAQLDMVRLGIGLHGVGWDLATTERLRPTVTLRSPIAQLRTVRPGESVGYGRRYMPDSERTIATVPIGYADGLSRRLGNGVGRMWLHGKAVPIVGAVCMDMVMLDVTDVSCRLGDMVQLFDAQHPITDLARDLGTIPYEVLTSIPPRVKRVYVHA